MYTKQNIDRVVKSSNPNQLNSSGLDLLLKPKVWYADTVLFSPSPRRFEIPMADDACLSTRSWIYVSYPPPMIADRLLGQCRRDAYCNRPCVRRTGMRRACGQRVVVTPVVRPTHMCHALPIGAVTHCRPQPHRGVPRCALNPGVPAILSVAMLAGAQSNPHRMHRQHCLSWWQYCP